MDRMPRFIGALVLLLVSECIVSQAQVPGSSSGAESSSTSTSIPKVGGKVTAPRVIYAPDPDYSEEGGRDRIEVTCILWLVVGADGKPRNIRVQRVIGHGLDEKAIEAVGKWKFKPALMDGKPVAVQINVEVSFRLDGSQLDRFHSEAKIAELERKASSGDVKAKVKLAEVYLQGRGVTQNENEGYRLLKEAADQGLPEAQFKMGEYAFAHGNQPGDYIASYMWYAIAQHNGYKHSDKKLKEVASKMPEDNIKEAKQRAQDWKPSK